MVAIMEQRHKLETLPAQVLKFSSSSDLLRLFFTAGLPYLPLLSITFFTIEQGGPQNSLFVFIQTPYYPCGVFRCSFIRDPVCISKMKRKLQIKSSQALFTLICFPLFAFLLRDCLLFDFCTFLLTT